MILTKKQTEALDFLEDQTTTELLFGGGAGGGKSALGVAWIILSCLKYPGTRYVIGRSKLKALKETTLNTFFEVAKGFGLNAGEHYVYNAQDSTIKLGESIVILKDLFLYPSDPNFDSLGSLEITGAFIDEANQLNVKAKEILKSRIRYKLDEFGLIPKILMTCNPAKNWVYSDFFKPAKNKELASNKKFIQALVTDNPFISKHYIENLKTLDSNSQERLLYGNWEYDSDPAKLMDFNLITDIFTNSFVEGGTKYITCDVARLGKDKTVIMLWSGFRVMKVISIDKNILTDLRDMILNLANEHNIPRSKIVCDEDGVGGGLVDMLGCMGFVNNSKSLNEDGRPTNYTNLKTQCYYKLADKINKGEIFVDCDPNQKNLLTEELEQVKANNVDSDGKLGIVAKDKVSSLLGRSPDYSDALMMRMIFVLKDISFTFGGVVNYR